MNKKELLVFISNLDTSSNAPCWIYTGALCSGYGMLHRTGQNSRDTRRAHRAAYEHWVGKIPKGKSVLHTCRNKACCNPNHLILDKIHRIVRGGGDKGRKAYRG